MWKNVYFEREILEMGVYSAVISFYDGSCGVFNIFRNANTEPEYSTITLCNKKKDRR